jgi:hypothetical protein
LCLFQGRVAGLLQPRPFLNKLSNALVIRKFCEQQRGMLSNAVKYLSETIMSICLPVRNNNYYLIMFTY